MTHGRRIIGQQERQVPMIRKQVERRASAKQVRLLEHQLNNSKSLLLYHWPAKLSPSEATGHESKRTVVSIRDW
jgi:hypothetical protein